MEDEDACGVQGDANAAKAPGLSLGMISALEEDQRRKLVDKLDKKIKCGPLPLHTSAC